MDFAKDKELLKELREIIDNRDICTVFQPIVSLRDGSILGYEALSRGPRASKLKSPSLLFTTAERYGLTWELEYLCRVKALENASKQKLKERLFINVDPKVIYDEKFKRGFTKELIYNFHLDPEKVIFEITERTAVEDYKSFTAVIDNYKNQGYKIALDDTGAGYSGLRMIAEISPQYIKIDMELIRDIHKRPINEPLVRALREFAYTANMEIIAEGIETYDELNTLINIGVNYGQGYLLQKPTEKLSSISEEIKAIIGGYQNYSKLHTG